MTCGPRPADPAGRPGVAASSPVHPPTPDGLVLSPLRALRPVEAVAGELARLTSPPYDVIDAAGVAALEASSDHNVVRLILPRSDGTGGQDRYQRAAQTLREWRDEGALRPDAEPGLYVYEQSDPVSGLAQRGLLGALALTPPEDGVVLPHENTMTGPVSDRLALYTAVEADLEPVFLVYDGGGPASRAVADADRQPPIVDVLLPDGLRHRLWALTDAELLAAIAADLRPRRALIADGHHRYATYLQRQRQAHEQGRGAGPWDLGLAFLVDATTFGPQVHPIHRVVPGQPAEQLAALASAGAVVHDLDGDDLDSGLAALSAAGLAGPAFLLVSGDGGTLRLITDPDPTQLAGALPADRSRAWRSLDVSVLHSYLVRDLWQLPDSTQSVRYAHDVSEALAVAAGTGGTAILLNPTPLAAVAEIASAGERMPAKSTLFTPKPRSGLLLRAFRDA